MLDNKDITGTNQSAANGLHTSVSGAINQHTPPYWRLALPALGVRYIGRYYDELMHEGRTTKAFDAIAGAWMFAVTGFFAYKTGLDMKSIFAETVAAEFDKKPEDVKISDLMHSQNKAVIVARNNFGFYNALRAAANSTFFVSYLPGKSKFAKQMQNTSAFNLGVGVNSAYLTMEIMGRGRTFFEQVQSFVDSKISNKNSLGESIRAIELAQLYQRNAFDNDKANLMDAKSDPATVRNSEVIFERMAELMNQTYFSKMQGIKSDFTLPEFLYLTGFNLIQPKKVKESLLYIEVANNYGIPGIKKAVQEINSGASIDDLITKYGVKIPDLQSRGTMSNELGLPAKKFTDGVAKGTNGYAVPAEKGEDNFVGRIKESPVGPTIPN